MMYKQGDILLIPIPFSDLTSSKRRPVLIDSCIRTDKIYTLSKSIVIKRFGSVKSEVLASVRDKIKDLLEYK